MIVTDFVENGDLRTYLQNNFRNLTWKRKIEMLLEIAKGLKTIHDAGYLHRDLHAGNILPDRVVQIADLGLSGPADLTSSKNLYGVLPYMAPETLRKATFSKSTDIYSFSMLMWEMASNKRPFADRSHGLILALDICKGARPIIPLTIPRCYKELMVECWNEIPSQRPSVDRLIKRLEEFLKNICWHSTSIIANQFGSAEKYRLKQLESMTNDVTTQPIIIDDSHPEALFYSRNLSLIIVNEIEVDHARLHSETLFYSKNRSSLDYSSSNLKYLLTPL
jgi:serine/threonine protein kinase